MKAFEYAAPGTVEEGLRAVRGTPPGRVRLLAGGTDLLPLMKSGVHSPDVLVDVKRLAGLDAAIELDAFGMSIGALATLADLEMNGGIAERYSALSQAAASAATPQLRNMATVGGTLMQRPRCWYYRNEHFHCWLKGGSDCMARTGQNQFHAVFESGPCRAVHPSDVACALSAFDAEVVLKAGLRGTRTISLSRFFVAPDEQRRVETVARSDDMIVSIRVPRPAAGTRSIYLKAMDRAVWAFALVSVAVVLRLDDDTVEDARVVLGGVANVPWDVSETARHILLGKRVDAALAAALARAAVANAEPLRMNGYKVPLVEALIKRAVIALAGTAH